MPTFDWTISFGNILTTIFMMGAFVIGAWKFIYNHLEHVRMELQQRALEIRRELIDHETTLKAELASHSATEHIYLESRFAALDKDIRELRDWTIVMRGKRE